MKWMVHVVAQGQMTEMKEIEGYGCRILMGLFGDLRVKEGRVY